MEQEPSEAGPSDTDMRYAQRIGGPLIDFDLAGELASLRASDSYHAADHGAVTLAKHRGIRVVLVAIRAGGQMQQHHTDSPITVQPLHGRIRFEAEGGGLELTPGRLIAAAAGIPHRVVGIEESAFLLTIGGREDG